MFILLFLLYSVLANASNYDFNSILNYFTSDESESSPINDTVPLKKKDISKQSEYITKRIDSCPDVGYFFKRELSKTIHPGPCYLCFCKENNTATCWRRENKRCDAEHYHHHGVGKRDARYRRSPSGLSDIFFRDATRDLFNKQSAQVCKPFEDSYSEGCPPADWCIGCTVCDCDANGHWDCHTLSFCPEKEVKKKKKNSHRGPYKRKIYRRKPRPSTNAITDQAKGTKMAKGIKKVTKSLPKTTSKVSKSSPVKRQAKKMQITAVKRGPQVNKNQPAKRSPQINKRAINKANPQLVKRSAVKRSQEIKKSQQIRRSQQVKSPVKRSSPVKKKSAPTRLPPGKKVTKKNAPVKRGTPVKAAVKKTTLIKRSPNARNNAPAKKQPAKRSPPSTHKPVLRKVKVTSKPASAPTTSQPLTTTLAQTSVQGLKGDINAALGQEMVKTFMQTFQKIIHKNLEKKVKKRSIVEDVNSEEDREDISKRRKKRQDSMSLDDNSNLDKRRKRDVVSERESVTTVSVNSTTSTKNGTSITRPPQDIIEITTNYPISTNTSAYNYYKYSVDNTAQTTTDHDKELYNQADDTHKNATAKRSIQNNSTNTKTTKDTVLKLIDNENASLYTTVPITIFQNKTLTTRGVVTLDNSYVANDLKFNQWSQVKALKDKEQNLRITLGRNSTSVTEKADSKNNSTTDIKKKLLSSSVTRQLSAVKRKYKIKKVVFTPNNKTSKVEKININPSLKTERIYLKAKRNDTKVKDFNIFVENVLNGFGSRNSTKKTRANKFKVIKYMQKIFKKMFAKGIKRKGSNNNRTKPARLNKDSVLETLCESFGPCYINRNNKIKLQPKIEDLSAETSKMLKSIKTIKGLLKLVDFAKYDKDLKNPGQNKKQNFKSDIQKLNAILRGYYSNGDKSDKLTQTQLTQIDYIKKNTQTFIKSTSRFAKVLNEIIDVISKDKDTNKETWKRISRYASKKKKTRQEKSESVEKMRDLLLKYNHLQNKFVEKMYLVLTKFQTPSTQPSASTKSLRDTKKFFERGYYENQFKGIASDNYEYQYQRTTNNSVAIQTYTKNIIKNLRKLKNLAQTLNSGTRRKRDLRDDDSMEYLLVLMEYLLKQNYPLDIAPVNDGIDLLIEAIKQAPDIKTIKKKVLLNTPSPNTTISYNVSSAEFNVSSEDSASNTNKLSKEDNFTSTQDDMKLNLIEESFDNDSEIEYKFMANRKYNVKSTTEIEFYKNEDETVVTEAVVEETTKSFIPQEVPSGVYTLAYEKDDTNKLIKLDKAGSSEEKENEKVIDVFHADIDDEVPILSSPSTTTEVEMKAEAVTSTAEPVTKAAIVFDDDKLKHYYKEDSSSHSADKKYLDWLDESFEEEVKTEANVTEALMKKTSEKAKKSLDNASSLSRDTYEEKKNKLDSEEVMYKKEMNLLNSLDYGTGKSESYGSDSKEVSEDKYASDTYYGLKAF